MISSRISSIVWNLATALALGATGCAVGDPDPLSTPEVEPTESGDGAGSGSADFGTWKILNIQYQAQETGYWCGPAATRMALSARMNPPSQQTLANQLGTTTNGTDYIGQITNVLNNRLGGAAYQTTALPNDPPTPGQKSQFWRDIVMGIDANYPLVANIVAPPNNHPPGYPNETIYHYFTIIGYNPQTWEVRIADSANFGGNSQYWLSFDQLATLVPPKGYAAIDDCSGGLTMGAIDAKFRALGGCASVVGAPVTEERPTPDTIGRYNVFANGSIYWTPATGAFEVHGVIRDKWSEVGWEAGVLGYPISDEVTTPDGVGRYNVFERGSIYWTPGTGAHEVHGVIRDAYRDAGWESGALGYPTSDEYAVTEGRKADFQRGSITWNATTNATTVTTP